uniref:Leukocyte surface antigen CD47 n=1 Tax=Otus sunia TaxID=257818 RepID=A0A8C8ANI2_9STRI
MCHFSFFFLGSAQLMFSVTDFVEKTECNKTVILPCHVINLKANNANVMFVTWKKQGQGIFSFDGAKQQFYRHATVPSANLASLADLPKGVASLMLDGAEAAVGNYSCEVTELNREGETTVELRQTTVLIIKSVYFSERICMSDCFPLCLSLGIIVAGVIFTAAAVVGTVLFVQGKLNASASLKSVYRKRCRSSSGIALKEKVFMSGFIRLTYFSIQFYLKISLFFYLCQIIQFLLSIFLTACPPLHGSVVIAGLAIMAIANLLSLAYVFIMGKYKSQSGLLNRQKK